MKLQATKKEIKERFMIYCAIYMLCAEIQEAQGPGRESLDGFIIDVDDIIEEVNYIPEDTRIMLDVDKIYGGQVELSYIDIMEGMLYVHFHDKDGHTLGLPAPYIPSDALRIVKRYLMRYKQFVK